MIKHKLGLVKDRHRFEEYLYIMETTCPASMMHEKETEKHVDEKKQVGPKLPANIGKVRGEILNEKMNNNKENDDKSLATSFAASCIINVVAAYSTSNDNTEYSYYLHNSLLFVYGATVNVYNKYSYITVFTIVKREAMLHCRDYYHTY